MLGQLDEYKAIPWQYAATLTFTNKALRKLKSGRLDDPSHLAVDYLRQIATKMHLRIGAISVCVWDNTEVRPHIHMVLIGYTGRSNRTLADCDPNQLEKGWPYGSALIAPVNDIDGALNYLELNERTGGNGFNLHGQRLLQKLLLSNEMAA